MKTRIVAVEVTLTNLEALTEAATVLRGGGLVAFPTETVYGLGANALDAEAVARIFVAKGRPANNPLIVHLADACQLPEVAVDWPRLAERLAEHFWPGPLTLVLPKRDNVPDIVTAKGPTVAVRVPAHPVAQALLRAVALPLAAPSANRSTELSPTHAAHVLRSLQGRIDILIDGGATPGGIESTVLDVTTMPPRLLRPGLIGVAELEAVIGSRVLVDPTGTQTAAVLPSPGMMPRHYAPRTPLECVDAGREAERIALLVGQRCRVGWVAFSQPHASIPSEVLLRVLPADPAGYAAQLYAVLHALDADTLDRILVTMPPKCDEWLAVRDRLRRAAVNG
jgi:L-threonylcarbamoyladenylate synthase